MPSALAASCLYLFAAFLQARRSTSRSAVAAAPIYGLAVAATLLHGYAAVAGLHSPEGINFGLFKAGSLIFWLMNISLLLSLLRRPLQNLMVILFPVSAVMVLIAAMVPGNASPFESLSSGLLLHIGTSALAYAVLTIAACQAATVAVQDYLLRHRHTRGLIKLLPPLQLMESMLFEIVWVGMILLTAAIASGFVFVDDIFAQHMVHKTVLTICAWLLFATLLWGHHRLGWRAQTAVRFTLGGFAALMLGYAGSKFVLEMILQRT
jgi:ABC-type uncharacterized transport system permease subunit